MVRLRIRACSTGLIRLAYCWTATTRRRSGCQACLVGCEELQPRVTLLAGLFLTGDCCCLLLLVNIAAPCSRKHLSRRLIGKKHSAILQSASFEGHPRQLSILVLIGCRVRRGVVRATFLRNRQAALSSHPLLQQLVSTVYLCWIFLKITLTIPTPLVIVDYERSSTLSTWHQRFGRPDSLQSPQPGAVKCQN